MSYRNLVSVAALLMVVAIVPGVAHAAGEKVVAWNNLGMHCMDSDYSLFAILPPYNTIYAQVMRVDTLVTDPTGLTVTYQGIADSSGSVNTTSVGKTNFWDHVHALFGADVAPDHGLAGADMPGAGNQPQAMSWDAAHSWWMAEGIPLTPYDDAGSRNTYPMFRVTVKDASGNVLATTDIVLPVSDEVNCRACHRTGGGDPMAKPVSGWSNDPNPELDYRRNILRRHDDLQASDSTFQAALAAAGYSTAGLYATAQSGTAVLCARCHADNALGLTGVAGVKSFTEAMHGYHASLMNGRKILTGGSGMRDECYFCHPGSSTRCLRGVMGMAVAANGTLAIQCQSCHAEMDQIGAAGRQGWLEEPGCGSCHTGTATVNSGEIRFTSVFDAAGAVRVPANPVFATNENAPAAGLSLYRFSFGHGGLACEACHGSTHAEYPTTHASDNVQSTELQGHIGPIADCGPCHSGALSTVTGGPHGMHPVDQGWVSAHKDVAEHDATPCQDCHGTDYRGTVLSRAFGNRAFDAFGTRSFWRGSQVGCYSCHNGPTSEDANPNRPPVVSDLSAATGHDATVAVPLSASDPDGDTLTLRVVSQAQHGTVGLSGTTASYIPLPGYGGSDSFTYAAWDGQVDSNLGTVSVTVTPAQLSATATASPTAGTAPLTVYFSGAAGGGSEPFVFDWDFGDGTAHSALPAPTHVFANPGDYAVSLAVHDSQGVSASASLTISAGSMTAAYRYLVAGVAHNPGTAGTTWRTDVAAVNLASATATVSVTFRSRTDTLSVATTIPAGGAVEWCNVVESLLGAAPSSDLAGSLEIASDQPLFANARTFNQTATGTYGQSMPALSEADALRMGETWVMPQLRKNVDFRSNIGTVNLGANAATLTVKLFDRDGLQVGSDVSIAVPAGEWRQANDVFSSSGAGDRDVAYATVELSSGDAVWAYGSLVDERTGDPTTIPVIKR